jgi:hypothetical protein
MIPYPVPMQKLELVQPIDSPSLQGRFAEQIRSLSKVSDLRGTWGIARQWLLMTVVFVALYLLRGFPVCWWALYYLPNTS